MLKEFRDFIAKGNMVEIAVGLLIASAFTGVVAALTKDIINPIIGLFGKADFSDWFFVLREGSSPGPYAKLADADKAGAIAIRYGDFLSVMINFLIAALVVFLILKAVQKVVPKPVTVTSVETKPNPEEVLLSEIRDLLKSRGSA